jgi:hypothetical protein
MREVYLTKPEARQNGSPHDLLISLNEIAPAAGMSKIGFHKRHSKKMREYGLLWKHGGTKTSPFATTRYFISIYFYLEAVRKQKEKKR